MMIRIAIAEDIDRLALALKNKIELSPDFEVKHMAKNGEELLELLNKDAVIDVILMDIQMPVMNGIEAAEKCSKRWPQIKVIMCTVFDDDEHLLQAIMAGAGGYLMKDESPAKIHKSIFEIIEGGLPMSAGIATRTLRLLKNGGKILDTQVVDDFQLTDREREVLQHLSTGLSYEQIADNLYISYGTVRKHIENIYRKLQVNSRTEALNKAGKNGLIG
ncbi:MAG: response regulator transcription factor [Bacteroidia bacterium]|nr:response regulator transcription factor [Bacteroidia bacterium]